MYPAMDEPASIEHAVALMLAMLCAAYPGKAADAARMMAELPLHSVQISIAGQDGEIHWGQVVPAAEIAPPDNGVRNLFNHLVYTIKTTDPEMVPESNAANLWLALERYAGRPSACTWLTMPDGRVAASAFSDGSPQPVRVDVVVRVPIFVLVEYSRLFFDPALGMDWSVVSDRPAEARTVLH